MSTLICGSFAYDNIMVFQDKFKNHILPDQIHILNVAFLVPELRREFGGCSGNIAYNLKLLGGDPVPMGAVGTDFAPYEAWIADCDITRDYLKVVEGQYTAQAYITTDMDDNQITAFHPGAMSFSHRNKVTDARNIDLGIISPDGREGMIEHARQFVEADIPFIFDPGQGLPMFDGDDLNTFIEQATYLSVNDYESQMIQERTGRTLDSIAEDVEAVIVTLGGKGSNIYVDGQMISVPVAKAGTLNDPTGCGDAYRGGLLYGISQGYDWEVTGRIASLMGAMKIEHHGTQNHTLDRDDFARRYEENFGQPLNW